MAHTYDQEYVEGNVWNRKVRFLRPAMDAFSKNCFSEVLHWTFFLIMLELNIIFYSFQFHFRSILFILN